LIIQPPKLFFRIEKGLRMISRIENPVNKPAELPSDQLGNVSSDAAKLVLSLASVLKSAMIPRISYTVDEAAAATGLTRRKIEGAINRGELKAKTVGKTLLISDSALRKFVQPDG
jgi:excisionase family DNA binding protein